MRRHDHETVGNTAEAEPPSARDDILAPGGGHRAVMDNSATNGAAVADAILVVAETEPEAASVEWAPTLPSAGLVVGAGPPRGRFHGRGPAPTIC